MFKRFTVFLSLFGLAVISVGCHILIAEQEWSENYALMDGAQSTVPQVIDGNLNTIGETQAMAAGVYSYGRTAGSEIIITLPEKKQIRKLIIHSDNIKKLNLYADKGGTALSDTDWQLIKEIKSVKSYPLEVPIVYAFPTQRIRLVILDTSDDASLYRRDKANFYTETTAEQRNRFGSTRGMFRRSYNGRISEIEIYGYKSAKETASANTENKREEELDTILE